MKNKMVLGILIVYFIILAFVLCLQVFSRNNGIVSAPPSSDDVAVEDRLDRAVVLYKESPVIMADKEQMLIDNGNASFVPIIENQVAYVPISFFKSAYGASVTADMNEVSAAIRLNNEALVIDKEKADLVSSSSEKDIEYSNRIFKRRNTIYVPLQVFAEAFDKEIHYYGDLVIVSEDKQAFTQDESADFINSLKAQVNSLPYVANESNLKGITDALGRNGFLKRAGAEDSGDAQEDNSVVKLITDKKSDVIQSDSQYIYYGRGNSIYIIDHNSNTAAGRIDTDESFTVSKLYLQGNILVAAGNRRADDSETPTEVTTSDAAAQTQAQGTEGGTPSDIRNNCDCAAAYVYDITDRSKPALKKEFSVDGGYVNSVKHGDYIYLLSQLSVFDSQTDGHFYPPSYRECPPEGVNSFLTFVDVQYFPEAGSDDYTVVSALNITDISVPANVKAYLCGGENVYLSENNLYVAKNRYTGFDTNNNEENTFIYRIGLSNGNIALNGKGNVKGYVLDRHSMNENAGYFSIATEYKEKGTNKNITNIYILNNNMELCGEANRVANNAPVQSAIFTGDMIFLIPKEQGQAMYLIDSSNPTNPAGYGVLKLSTGSILIYPYDESHILTIDDGDNVLKANAYSIEGRDNTVKLYSEELGKDNIITSLFANADFFTFDKEKNMFMLPVTITDKESGRVTFDGSYIYELNLDDGFRRIGAVEKSGDFDTPLQYCKLNGYFYCFGRDTVSAIDINDIDKITEITLK